MKALKYIVYILLGFAALMAALGFFAKSSYHIERSITIDAPKALVYEQLRLYENSKDWSPWTKLDPNMKVSETGTDGEVGFSNSWVGNDEVGEGSQTLKAISADRIDFQLDLVRPFKSSFPVYFNIVGDDTLTKVTWALEPKLPFPINVWSMFTDIDKAMGDDYARGLGYLKRRCEGMAHKKYHGYEIAEEDLEEYTLVGIRETIKIEKIDSFYSENLSKIIALIDSLKWDSTGLPTGLYWTFDQEEGTTDMAVAIPVKKVNKLPKGFQAFNIREGKALVINYLGDYTELMEAHMGMEDYMASNKLRNIPPAIELYVLAAQSEPDTAKWLTKVIYYVEPNPDSVSVNKD